MACLPFFAQANVNQKYEVDEDSKYHDGFRLNWRQQKTSSKAQWHEESSPKTKKNQTFEIIFHKCSKQMQLCEGPFRAEIQQLLEAKDEREGEFIQGCQQHEVPPPTNKLESLPPSTDLQTHANISSEEWEEIKDTWRVYERDKRRRSQTNSVECFLTFVSFFPSYRPTMMSNCNSPLLHRASPFRAESVDRGDAYQVREEEIRRKFHCKKALKCFGWKHSTGVSNVLICSPKSLEFSRASM